MTRVTGRTAWLIWGVGLSAYALGAFHRSSLAVAGLRATDRFEISSTQLGTFVVLQLAVYAVAQVPVGVLVDRFGPRRILLAGTLLMSVGQVVFAVADSYVLALVARVLVGLGDATTFVCVLRLVSAWFPARRIPLVVQLTGPLGQLGTIVATVPMAWALSQLGWERAYGAAAVLGLLVSVAVLGLVRDGPDVRVRRGTAMAVGRITAGLQASWAAAGTRLGFWIHFSQHFSATCLGLLWGFPWFVQAQGTSPTEAGVLLTVLVASVICAAPAIGWLCGSREDLRVRCVLGSLVAVAGVWTVVLAWPGAAPLWMLTILVMTVGACGPFAMVGFDIARGCNPPERLASATGIVNQGGFISSLAVVLLIGVLMDLALEVWGVPVATAFTVAFACQYLFWTLAATQIWRLRHAG